MTKLTCYMRTVGLAEASFTLSAPADAVKQVDEVVITDGSGWWARLVARSAAVLPGSTNLWPERIRHFHATGPAWLSVRWIGG